MPDPFPFAIGVSYTRNDVYRIVGVPESQQRGDWDTGYHFHGEDCVIFCNIGSPGRTGHDYGNYFVDEDLVWFGKTGSKLGQPQIARLLEPGRRIYVFSRKESRQPFVFVGLAVPRQSFDETPVRIRWSFRKTDADSISRSPDEVGGHYSHLEGAVKQVLVNRYERNPAARSACIAAYGTACVVCGFDFAVRYGSLGSGYIVVHHLVPIASIGKEYVLDPVADLRPVCANCHAMLHSCSPPLSIDELRAALCE